MTLHQDATDRVPLHEGSIEGNLQLLFDAAEFERIVGIKDSSGDMAFMMRMISAVQPMGADFTFLTGWEAVLVPMLLIGVDGGTNATSGVVPELTRKLYDLTRSGHVDEAMRLQFRMLELFDAMLYSADFPEGFRAAVELQVFRWGAAANRKPSASSLIGRHCKRCFNAFWPISATSRTPSGGCPPRTRRPRPGSDFSHRGQCAERTATSGCRLNEPLGLLESDRSDADTGGIGRDGEVGQHPRDPVRELNDFYGVMHKNSPVRPQAIRTAIGSGGGVRAEQMGGSPVVDVILRPDAEAMRGPSSPPAS